jgi:DNA-binding IclR family transcriptional regulator
VEELLPRVASIAAPIASRQRIVVGAIAVSGPVERICADRAPRPELADLVMDSARAISRELGWRPW